MNIHIKFYDTPLYTIAIFDYLSLDIAEHNLDTGAYMSSFYAEQLARTDNRMLVSHANYCHIALVEEIWK